MSNVKKPESIGEINMCGHDASVIAFYPRWDLESGDIGKLLITTDQSEAYANALAAEGIRNALRVAAAVAASKAKIGALRSVEATLAARTAKEIETQILALIIE